MTSWEWKLIIIFAAFITLLCSYCDWAAGNWPWSAGYHWIICCGFSLLRLGDLSIVIFFFCLHKMRICDKKISLCFEIHLNMYLHWQRQPHTNWTSHCVVCEKYSSTQSHVSSQLSIIPNNVWSFANCYICTENMDFNNRQLIVQSCKNRLRPIFKEWAWYYTASIDFRWDRFVEKPSPQQSYDLTDVYNVISGNIF